MKQKGKLLLILTLVFTMTFPLSIPAASYAVGGRTYTLKIAGKKQKRTAINAAYCGTRISTYAPGYIYSDTSMYSAYYIFKKTSSLGTSYSYNSKTKKATLKRGSKTIVYTMDSSYAYVNGTKKKLPTPARKVYSYSRKKNYIYVPGAFTASNLDLGYLWINDKRTGNFYLKSSVSAGGSMKVKYAGKVQYRKAVNARYNNSIIRTNMPGFLDGSTSLYSAYWIFGKCTSLGTSYSYSSTTKKVTIRRGSNKIIMTLDSRKATLNGSTFTLPAAPRKVYSYVRMGNYIMVPGEIICQKLGLKYSWNSRLSSGMITKPSSGGSSDSSSSLRPTTSATKITASSTNYSIRIKKPSGLSSSAVVSNDDYWKKRLQLIIQGNYSSHFSSSANRTIKDSLSYSVSYSGGKTYINLKTSTIKGFSVTQTSSYIYVKYAAPKSMYHRVIVVDAGHGGSDSGATGNGYYEKNMTLKIVQNMKSHFDTNTTYKVYYTRLSDWYPSLSYRYKLANEVNADRFLSVHINSASSSARGTETLYKTYKTYAQKIQDYALKGMGYAKGGSYDRKLKYRTDLAVLNGPKMTTALVEMGFISNKTEASRINSRTSTIGNYLYQAICQSF